MPSYTFRREVYLGRTLQRVGNQLHDDAVPEALARRRPDRGAVAFDPVEGNAAVVETVPCHPDAPLRRRQRAVLRRVGRELVQGEADVLHGIGVEEQLGTVELGALAGREWLELRLRQVLEPGALPILSHQHVLRLGKPLKTMLELLEEVVEAVALLRGLE